MNRRVRVVPSVPVADLTDALRDALDGTGRAVLPVPAGDDDAPPGPDVPAEVALLVRTSGSTGAPRDVMLTADALRASAAATHRRLSGPGHWLLALPTGHIAGLQVVLRSVAAGTEPVELTGPFRADTFRAAAERVPTDLPRYVSLVPTQLVRVLADPAATATLAGFDAVLLGGAAAPGSLVEDARRAGIRVVTTYGMSETCGGCVYDGVPLDGVDVRIDDDGRIALAGPMLAAGYRGDPDLTARTFRTGPDGTRRLHTSDLGRWADGRLTVLGRADDVLITGGEKVPPAAVERVVADLPGVAEVCVVGVPDPQWGQAVTAVLVLHPGAEPPALADVRSTVAGLLGPAAAPRHLLVLDALPLRGPGKIDRRGVAALAADRLTH
ncbi:o-succinylbenzoate--CoA ligase [Cellulomonas denverensis]|uniref:AMP-binding protein n=1 Tax=Cellulomonas denverensis TaxID=264297 RepID=A0A7X6QXY5_9CELL|nr:o-succinylbenzoate--CoA ligase [Cellulomonas denverensis]NKY21622.1 AMP-binding protein [Cellulomonas denverensis]GIG25513.1 O-succinylbenzoic acid--CoA ligase [Cellulomonas denverensis]